MQVPPSYSGISIISEVWVLVYFLKSSDSLFQPNDFDLEVRGQQKGTSHTHPGRLLFTLVHLSGRVEESLQSH